MFLFRDFTLNADKEIRFSLKNIYGIGLYKAQWVTAKLGLSFPYFFNNLNHYNYSILFYLLKNLIISDVRIKRFVELDISNLVNISSYKGIRHNLCLPVNGQRTRTNARTQRSKRIKPIVVNQPVVNNKKKR